jgi:hypothetical protein
MRAPILEHLRDIVGHVILDIAPYVVGGNVRGLDSDPLYRAIGSKACPEDR